MITTHATERFFRCKILRCHFLRECVCPIFGIEWVIVCKDFCLRCKKRCRVSICVVKKIVKMSNRAHLISYCTSFILLLDCFHMHQCTTYFLTNPIIKHFPLYALFGNTYEISELKIFQNYLVILQFLLMNWLLYTDK